TFDPEITFREQPTSESERAITRSSRKKHYK
ncbi:unnamed protein product, partial [Oikopleura dioica]